MVPFHLSSHRFEEKSSQNCSRMAFFITNEVLNEAYVDYKNENIELSNTSKQKGKILLKIMIMIMIITHEYGSKSIS